MLARCYRVRAAVSGGDARSRANTTALLVASSAIARHRREEEVIENSEEAEKKRFFGDFRDTRFVGADAHEYGRSHHEPVNSQETVE